jgi:hypothetical protein
VPLDIDWSSIQFIQQALAAVEGVRADVERLPPWIPVMLRASQGVLVRCHASQSS